MLPTPVISDKESRTEKILFGFFTLLNLVPLFIVRIFPTLDGAAHLYNSTLIRHLLTGNDFLQQFFVFNSEPVPNWTGHALLLILNLFLPAWIAEKTLMVLIIAALPLAFRYLVLSIKPENRYLSYLAFLFSYSFAFYMGFYNFYIAIVLMLFTLGFWKRNSAVNVALKKPAILFLLVTLVYFSHIMIYGLLCFFLAIIILFDETPEPKNSDSSNRWKRIFNTAGPLFLICLPTLILFTWYFLSRPSPDVIGYLDNMELWNRLLKGSPFIVFDDKEANFTEIFSWMLLTFGGLSVFAGMIKNGKISISSRIIQNTWFLITVLMLTLYFILPDSMKWTSYISSRMGLLVFIFGAVWVASLDFSKRVSILIPIVVIIISVPRHMQLYESHKPFSEVADACYNASEFIHSNSIVLPLRYYDWFAGHFSNYLAAEKPVAVLENYECGLDYFPLRWNMEKIPNTLIGETSCYDIPCAYWVFDSSHVAMKIDYILVLGNQEALTDSCHRQLRKTIMKGYDAVNRTEDYELFRLSKK